ncbi:MAG: ATP-binding protein [Candidatus Limnocylindrales bacterium]
MPVTPSPSAEPEHERGPEPGRGPGGRPGRRRTLRGWVRRVLPRSFAARLTIAFSGVVALTLVLVFVGVINRVDDYFYQQSVNDLQVRAQTVRHLIVSSLAASVPNDQPIVSPTDTLNPVVVAFLTNPDNQRVLADDLAQADVEVSIGLITRDGNGNAVLVPASNGGHLSVPLEADPRPGQARDDIPYRDPGPTAVEQSSLFEYGIQVELSNPYTYRASTLAAIFSLLIVIAIAGLLLSVVVAFLLARRFSVPLRRLTEAARDLTEGDFARRVEMDPRNSGSTEIVQLSRQFNQMAGRLAESVAIIRHDRDRSRDFLADVSHELRTPISAMRMFNELLRDGADADPATRAEFLESSRQQLERLDWLAQNLLELSKLDSGLVLLDLRPDDLRTAVESAVEQAEPTARRRGVGLTLQAAGHPLRIRHDPQRIGQVVSNLIGNALKFTPSGGQVNVEVRAAEGGARIEVRDTGVGIDTTELPRIFERFYRGSRANEARSSGSGLGLAIVKSIVDMHGGRVTVDSRLGQGSSFVVSLPLDPRQVEPNPVEPNPVGPNPVGPGPVKPAGESLEPGTIPERAAEVSDSSSAHPPRLNPQAPR